MALDPLDLSSLPATLAGAIDRAHASADEIVDRAINQEASLLVDRANAGLGNQIHAILAGLQDFKDGFIKDLQATLQPAIDESAKWRAILERINLTPPRG